MEFMIFTPALLTGRNSAYFAPLACTLTRSHTHTHRHHSCMRITATYAATVFPCGLATVGTCCPPHTCTSPIPPTMQPSNFRAERWRGQGGAQPGVWAEPRRASIQACALPHHESHGSIDSSPAHIFSHHIPALLACLAWVAACGTKTPISYSSVRKLLWPTLASHTAL